MAVRNDFTAGEVLAAADLNDTFASKLPYSYGTATPSTTVDGFLWYDENSTPPAPKFWDGAAFQALTSGKILQVVRATDSTDRSTNSTSTTDSGMSITITPNKSDSAVIIILIARFYVNRSGSGDERALIYLTDNSNNALSGANSAEFGLIAAPGNLHFVPLTVVGYSTPATTSATTYKVRYSVQSASTTAVLQNSTQVGQLYAIEVSA